MRSFVDRNVVMLRIPLFNIPLTIETSDFPVTLLHVFKLHGVTFRKTGIYIVTSVRIKSLKNKGINGVEAGSRS
jgi:hypothetical protein